MNKSTIFFDLDGVCANFNKKAKEILNKEIDHEGRNISVEEWKILNESTNHLYLSLDVMEGAEDLIEFASLFPDNFDIKFLSSLPSKYDVKNAKEDKKKWVSINFPDIPLIVVSKSSAKSLWCKPEDILIDDKSDVCLDWIRQGGFAIRYVTYEETKYQLFQLIYERLLGKEFKYSNFY